MIRFRCAANLSLLFGELPVSSRPAAAAAAGFTAVESWWPFDSATPGDDEVDRWTAAVSDAGVELIGLNFYGGDMAAGERGIMVAPRRTREFLDSIDIAIGIGTRLECPTFNALHGRYLDDAPVEQQDETVLANLQAAANAAADIGAEVGIEPISGIPDFPIRTARQAADLVARARASFDLHNVMIWGDLYHLTANGDDVDAAIETYGAQMGHVQIADFPGRHEPGSGQVDLLGHLHHLAAVGYSGWVGLEFIPSGPSTVDALVTMRNEPGYREALDLSSIGGS